MRMGEHDGVIYTWTNWYKRLQEARDFSKKITFWSIEDLLFWCHGYREMKVWGWITLMIGMNQAKYGSMTTCTSSEILAAFSPGQGLRFCLNCKDVSLEGSYSMSRDWARSCMLISDLSVVVPGWEAYYNPVGFSVVGGISRENYFFNFILNITYMQEWSMLFQMMHLKCYLIPILSQGELPWLIVARYIHTHSTLTRSIHNRVF